MGYLKNMVDQKEMSMKTSRTAQITAVYAYNVGFEAGIKYALDIIDEMPVCPFTSKAHAREWERGFEVACDQYDEVEEVVNLMSGKTVVQSVNTPWCCNVSSETYWSM